MKSGACVMPDTSPALHVLQQAFSIASDASLPHLLKWPFHCLKLGRIHTTPIGVTQTALLV